MRPSESDGRRRRHWRTRNLLTDSDIFTPSTARSAVFSITTAPCSAALDAPTTASIARQSRLQAKSVAVHESSSFIRPGLTAIGLAREDSPRDEDLATLTDSLSSMSLLKRHSGERLSTLAVSLRGATSSDTCDIF